MIIQDIIRTFCSISKNIHPY